MDVASLPQELQGVYRVLEVAHQQQDTDLSVDDLSNYFFATQPKDKEFYIELFDNLRTLTVSDQSVMALAKSLKRSSLLRKLATTSYDASEGKKDAVEAVAGLYAELEALEHSAESSSEFEFVTDDLDSLLSSTIETPGLRWRLMSLNHHLGSLRTGDFGFIFN